MARRRKRKASLPAEPVRILVSGFSHDGRGVARIGDKTVFIEGALLGEEVSFTYVDRRRSYDVGVVCEVHKASPHRVQPRCPYFGVCGGCSLQHFAAEEQIKVKQGILLENFGRLGRVEPKEILPPLVGPHWGYRRKARLGVRYVIKKERVLVGFREKRAPYLADMGRCEVLHPSVGERIAELAELIGSLQAYDRIAQIEVAVDDTRTALVMRNLDELSEGDQAKLIAYGRDNHLCIYLQPKGPDSVVPLWPEQISLSYALPDFDVKFHFLPTDFTQVNADINRAMVKRALDLLQPQASQRVLDLFCGIGNFTLPLARSAREVVGVEGSPELVRRARENAELNDLDNVEFHAADLTQELEAMPWWKQGFDKVLLDPARDGAMEAIPYVARLGAERIVYVSCNPATLARDAGILVHQHGYVLDKAGVMDMFPHTAHVESVALFVKG